MPFALCSWDTTKNSPLFIWEVGNGGAEPGSTLFVRIVSVRANPPFRFHPLPFRPHDINSFPECPGQHLPNEITPSQPLFSASLLSFLSHPNGWVALRTGAVD